MTEEIDETLKKRGARYGEFGEHAKITQRLKDVMHESPNWEALEPAQKKALEMIVHKIGSILNGTPDYIDSWRDLVGYARLVEQILNDKEGATDVMTEFMERIDGVWETVEDIK